MGGKPVKPSVVQDNTGSIVNEVQIHQAEIVNPDLKYILYMLVTIQIIQLFIVFYKVWARNLKKKYVTRAKSMELL